MTYVAVRRPSMRGNKMTETVADMEVGDQGETLVAMNLRAESDYKSEIIDSIQDQAAFMVVETSEGHRALISSGNKHGWISTKTDLDQPLAKLLMKGNGQLKVFEALVQLNMRDDHEFKSEVTATLDPKTQFDVIEVGPNHRYKILADGEIGWISGKTDLDQPLIREVGAEHVTRMSKNLDSYIVRAASQAQVTKVLSSKSRGAGLDRMASGVTKSKSMEERAAKSGASPSAKSPKDSPKLGMLAVCCSN